MQPIFQSTNINYVPFSQEINLSILHKRSVRPDDELKMKQPTSISKDYTTTKKVDD